MNPKIGMIHKLKKKKNSKTQTTQFYLIRNKQPELVYISTLKGPYMSLPHIQWDQKQDKNVPSHYFYSK